MVSLGAYHDTVFPYNLKILRKVVGFSMTWIPFLIDYLWSTYLYIIIVLSNNRQGGWSLHFSIAEENA